MEQHGGIRRAFWISLLTFVVLAFLVVMLFKHVDFVGLDTESALKALMFFVVTLIVVNVFQALVIHESAKKMAENMTEEMFFESRELFSELYQNSPVPYILISRDGTITSTNMASLRLFGVEKGQMEGVDMFKLIESDDQERVSLLSGKMRGGLFVNDEEVRIIRADGNTRWVLLSLFPFNDTSGRRGGLLTLVDITKQKEIDRVKSEFVSLASHQLKTPIAVMKWNIELLSIQKENLTPQQLHNIEKVEYGIERMVSLVDDFLNVSKLELGTLVPNKEEVNFVVLLNAIVDEHRKSADDKGVQIVRDYDERLTTLSMDTHLFQMAVGNLISNAVKYTKKGGNVTLRTKMLGTSFSIEVVDTGIGIPEEEQDKIFSKVFRASNAQLSETEGTGLGLYVVKEVVEVLGGEIRFVSKEGVGSTFTILLPR